MLQIINIKINLSSYKRTSKIYELILYQQNDAKILKITRSLLFVKVHRAISVLLDTMNFG